MKRPTLTLLCHAVLAPLSGRYPPPRGRYPRVTHPCATLPGAEAPFSFDLHVLSAPLTFVLSQDQTLQLNSGVSDCPELRPSFLGLALTSTLTNLCCSG